MDMTDTIIPKSDQLNAEDLLTGPRTFTITEVRKGSVEQPVDIHLAEFPGRPFKPSKTVRRILVSAWGPDAAAYAGRRMTLYRDPDVKFGGLATGGIRVSHLSHIDKPMTLVLAVSKGKRAPYVVKVLADDAPVTAPVPNYMADARAAKNLAEWREVWQRAKDAGHLTDALKAELTPIGEALKAEKPVEDPPTEPVKATAERAEDPITPKQLTALNAALSSDLGLTEREDKLAYLSGELGREIGSSKDVTKSEAMRLLDKLAAEREDPPAEPPLDGDWPAVTEPGGAR